MNNVFWVYSCKVRGTSSNASVVWGIMLKYFFMFSGQDQWYLRLGPKWYLRVDTWSWKVQLDFKQFQKTITIVYSSLAQPFFSGKSQICSCDFEVVAILFVFVTWTPWLQLARGRWKDFLFSPTPRETPKVAETINSKFRYPWRWGFLPHRANSYKPNKNPSNASVVWENMDFDLKAE